MIIKNAVVYGADFIPVETDVEIENEKIKSTRKTDEPGEDFSDCAVVPGFIDVHVHGFAGSDVCDGDPDSALKMSEGLVGKGVTSFCPTTMTVSLDKIRESFRSVANSLGREKGAYIHGINMEGPFISAEKKGAQSEKHILKPDFDIFRELDSICPVKLVDIAPEVAGAYEFIEKASKICVVSAAHTAADYRTGKEAIKRGVSHATHLYNAMTGLGSREAGMVGAALDGGSVFTELICDGVHVCPATLRITFEVLGEDRAVVISDATMAAGLPDGEYFLGGQKVFKKDGAVRLADGVLAGSCANLFDEFHNLLKFGVPLRSALKAASVNPAKSIGADGITGTIEPGKNADLLVLSRDLTKIKAVFVKGRRAF